MQVRITFCFESLALICLLSFPLSAYTVYVANFPPGHNPTRYIEQFDSSGQGSLFPAGVAAPTGLAADASGNLYVVDHTNNTILRFDTTGNSSVFSTTLSSPNGLAIDGSGNVYTLAGGGFEKFDPNGNELTNITFSLGLIGSITCDKDGNVYLGDSVFGRIFKYDSNGNESLFASDLGPAPGPTGLACDSNGNLYASDYSANSILKFTPGGTPSVFATTNLSGPYGLAFDNAGDLFVANAGDNTVAEFDLAGNGTLFASSGLDIPEYVAVQIPEPAAAALVTLGFSILFPFRRSRCRALK
jgi:sugar lactone lactonase YvrE